MRSSRPTTEEAPAPKANDATGEVSPTDEPLVEETANGVSDSSEPSVEGTPSFAASQAPFVASQAPQNPADAAASETSKAAATPATPARARYAEPTTDAVPNPPEPKPNDTSDARIFEIPVAFDGYGRYIRPTQNPIRQVGNWR